MKLFATLFLCALFAVSFSEDNELARDMVVIAEATDPDSVASATAHILTHFERWGGAYTAFGTLLLAIFAFFTFLLSRRTFWITREQSKRESRAYLTANLKEGWCKEYTDDMFKHQSLHIRPTIRNHGKTPAKYVKYCVYAGSIPRENEGRPKIDEAQFETTHTNHGHEHDAEELGLIGPEQELSPTVISIYSSKYEQYKSPPPIRRLPDGTNTARREEEFCFYGKLTYSDVFGDSWETFFAWYLIWIDNEKLFFPIEIQPHGQERSIAHRKPILQRLRLKILG